MFRDPVILQEAASQTAVLRGDQLRSGGASCESCGRGPSPVHQTLETRVSNGTTNGTTKSAKRFPQKDPVHIIFENIVYTAPLGFRKGEKEILHNVNGRFAPGQLVAIMGPSGAGKSTLLDVLSGYKISGIQGTVYTNGRPRNMVSFRKSSCYITQDDRLQPLLTVWENMCITADLKLGFDVPKCEKEDTIREILEQLGLDGHINTRTAQLSGGQKKRLSIALELIDNPLVLFLDEPTTGLDSSSCSQCVKLLRDLAQEGRTIVCTIHQPSASLFQLFDQVYVLGEGRCLYQGSSQKIIPFLESVNLPCPRYHNPADYVIELACGEYGQDKVDAMVEATSNGKNLQWFDRPDQLPSLKKLRETHKPIKDKTKQLEGTSQYNQLKIMLRRGYLKAERDTMLTYMRIGVNVIVGLLFGVLYWQAGWHGGKVLDNYNLIFSILMHHMMSTMMLTILTFPTEMSILMKEHFNRWYSLKVYYASITIIDFPISIVGCLAFTAITYWMTGQPLEWNRAAMFTTMSLLTVFMAQSFGLMIGSVFNVVNGTFMGPILAVPLMMFAGFGVTLADLPPYLYWGSTISYLKYCLEGSVGAIYGLDRPTMFCPEDEYCHYKYPRKFLKDISMQGDQFWNDVTALLLMLFIFRTVTFFLLRWKLNSMR